MSRPAETGLRYCQQVLQCADMSMAALSDPLWSCGTDVVLAQLYWSGAGRTSASLRRCDTALLVWGRAGWVSLALQGSSTKAAAVKEHTGAAACDFP